MNTNPRKIFPLFLIISFLIIIWVPIMQMVFPIFEQIESTEKRALSKIPKLNLLHPYNFVTDYEKYFNDNFGFRNNLITLRSLILFYVYLQSPSGYVVLGNNGMLFFTPGLVSNSENTLYSKEVLDTISKAYRDELRLLSKNNIYFISVIAPNKHTIYSEYLPVNYALHKKSYKLDQRIKAIKQIANSQEIDLRKTFIEEKKNKLIYYKTDSHWNNYGSFLAYQEIMKNIKNKFPNLEPLNLNDFDISIRKKVDGDLATLLGIPTYFEDNEVLFKLKKSSRENKLDNKKLDKVIIYHDSFFDPQNTWGTVNFLSYHFSKVISLPIYKVNDIYRGFDNKFILEEKPEVVVYEAVERDI